MRRGVSPALEARRRLRATRAAGQTNRDGYRAWRVRGANTNEAVRKMKSLEERINELPPELRREVEDFVEFLQERQARKPRGKLTFGWAGALKDLRDKYSSVELQHKITDWMIGDS